MPISIPSVWMRILGKCLAKHSADRGAQLQPLQVGVRVANAPEQVVFLVRGALAMHKGSVLVKADLRNAFGSIHRTAMLGALLKSEDCAGMQYFLAVNGDASTIRWTRTDDDTSETLSYQRGVAQGDPMSPLFFSEGLHPALQEIAKTKEAYLTISFLDDVFVVGSPTCATSLLEGGAFQAALNQHGTGLTLNTDKTLVYDPWHVHEARKSHPLGSLKAETKGTTILGAYVGDRDFILEELKKRLGEVEKLCKKLVDPEFNLEPQHAYAILRYCVTSKVNHLWRTTPPSVSKSMALRMDDLVWKTTAMIAGLPPDEGTWGKLGVREERARTIAALPFSLGGLGLGCALRNATTGHLAGFSACLKLTKHHHAEIHDWWLAKLQAREDKAPASHQNGGVLRTRGHQQDRLQARQLSRYSRAARDEQRETPAKYHIPLC